MKIKKFFTIGTIVGVFACAIMLILTIFKINFFEGIKANILISIASLTVGGFFAISAINLINYNKKLAYVSLGFIALAVLLVIIGSWIETGGIFSKLTFTVAIISVLFNVIVSGILKLQKRYLALQIISYIITASFAIVLLLMIYNIFSFANIMEIFFVLLILTLVGIITISILSNKVPNLDNKNFVKISLSEYEELVAKAKKFDELNNK